MKPSYPWVLFVEMFLNYYYWFNFTLIIDLFYFLFLKVPLYVIVHFSCFVYFIRIHFFPQWFLMILCVTMISVVISLLFLIRLTWALTLSLISLAKSSLILFIFLNNQLLVSFIILNFLKFYLLFLFILIGG